jgi:hypothetical protein
MPLDHNIEAERDVHRMLGDLDSFDRVVTLLAAVLDHDRGAVRQTEWLACVLEIMAKRLPETERVILASQLVDIATRLVLRWH